MLWSEIRETYPAQWLVIEALAAHTTPTGQRVLDDIAVIEVCKDGNEAMQSYRRWHLRYPEREFYFVNTSRERLDIRDRRWVGIRKSHAVALEG